MTGITFVSNQTSIKDAQKNRADLLVKLSEVMHDNYETSKALQQEKEYSDFLDMIADNTIVASKEVSDEEQIFIEESLDKMNFLAKLLAEQVE